MDTIVCKLMHGYHHDTKIYMYISEAPSPSSPFSVNLLSGKLMLVTVQLREWELDKMLCLPMNESVKYPWSHHASEMFFTLSSVLD